MAGDWIKMRSNLWDDPRVARLCDLTDSGEAAVIGGLYWLWSTADQHSEDGCMPGLSIRSINRKTGIDGFAEALVEIDWLSFDEQGVVLTRFEEHNGASAKARAQTARRVSKHEANAKLTQKADTTNAPSVSDALARDREEKEKEKEKTNSTLASDAPRAVEYSIALRECGIDSNPADPRLHALAEQGVALETVRAAAQKARRAKPNERISTAYVTAIVSGWATEAAKVNAVGAVAPTGKPAKFDPVAFVNRNRTSENHECTDDCIDVEAKHVA